MRLCLNSLTVLKSEADVVNTVCCYVIHYTVPALKAGAEVQRDFTGLDPQDKQVVKERFNIILKMKELTVGVNSLLSSWME